MPSSLSILDHFSALTVPRRRWRVVYPLPEILLLIPCATLCGMDDFVEIRLWGEQRLDFLHRFLPYARGVPAHDTLDDVVDALDADLFKAGFTAWAARRRLVLGQAAVADESNEITAIPYRPERLELRGALVTPDAMGTRTAIAETIVARGDDCLTALKGNRPSPHDDVRLFADPGASIADTHESLDNDARRLKRRRAGVCHDVAWMVSDRRHPGEQHRPPLPPAPRAPSPTQVGPTQVGLARFGSALADLGQARDPPGEGFRRG
ncbi:hypothetical protein HNR00_001720 [Methylorubrum rhodinum]|uniref:H repeat-associated protein N-terminal domain-containing protein n=1 Tax=Methylorubrum rhodinum TaxID=29428 RepID=A0A840ZGA2_9HYPH|nr:ISAs1 family transposase [Methylorubrum rhodinum]MBB5757012.1 hypothetical protein [Methylorubrum rhodinum]